jgi:hypothetical protein
MRTLPLVATGLLCAATASAQLSIEHRGSVLLPSQLTDQHGVVFDVAGLSGVTHLGGDRYAAVMDNSNKVVLFDLLLSPAGDILGLANVAGLTLAHSGDHEGIAVSGPGTLLVCNEANMSFGEYQLADGSLIRMLATPLIFSDRRPNLGLESLAVVDGIAWTANEEALNPDGFRASTFTGTAVRILRYDLLQAQPLDQVIYLVEKIHGPVFPFGAVAQSGLSELVVLPDGRLLALERSFAFTTPFFQTRIFVVDVSNATNVAEMPGVHGTSITPVEKSLVYVGGHNNMEGLCLGPQLPSGDSVLVGVVDDGDPVSEDSVEVFVLRGLDASSGCVGDIADDFGTLGSDDAVSFGDFLALLGLIGPCPGGTLGCDGDFADDFGSIVPEGGPDGQVSFGDFLALLGLIGPCL